ncbi:MAG TPA: hypothetical protein VHP11_17110 [Tepidisphaeraceae bacterium]|nr:hypothetical protein [Tepidisphaeraceae bacterium]
MPDPEYYFPEHLRNRPRRVGLVPKAVAVCAVIGGVYGAAIGSIITTTEDAAYPIGVAAGFMAFVFLVPSMRWTMLLRLIGPLRYAALFVSIAAALAGAMLGGFFGIVAMSPLGAILGAGLGWFCGRAFAGPRARFLSRLLNAILGVILGACIGATVMALRRDQPAALLGIAWGVGIGITVGAALCLLFVGRVLSILRIR